MAIHNCPSLRRQCCRRRARRSCRSCCWCGFWFHWVRIHVFDSIDATHSFCALHFSLPIALILVPALRSLSVFIHWPQRYCGRFCGRCCRRFCPWHSAAGGPGNRERGSWWYPGPCSGKRCESTGVKKQTTEFYGNWGNRKWWKETEFYGNWGNRKCCIYRRGGAVDCDENEKGCQGHSQATNGCVSYAFICLWQRSYSCLDGRTRWAPNFVLKRILCVEENECYFKFNRKKARKHNAKLPASLDKLNAILDAVRESFQMIPAFN